MNINEFQHLISQKGTQLYRDMPWRHDTSCYAVFVSEIMLQQTQVERVIPKFNEFISLFPDFQTLSRAKLSNVICAWEGLGYNRRAKFLYESACYIVQKLGGVMPDSQETLCILPGIGTNTAGAIMAYAYNKPAIFIETNIRTVYIHHFFPDQIAVDDARIRELLAETIDVKNPRTWYWALMDYGTQLKQHGIKAASRSKQYVKQSPLKGSVREIRGKIITSLRESSMDEGDLEIVLHSPLFQDALSGLIRDGLIMRTDTKISLVE